MSSRPYGVSGVGPGGVSGDLGPGGVVGDGGPGGVSATAIVAVEGLGKTFHPPAGVRELLRGRLTRAPVAALADVSFRVAPGEIVCLMGPNGAGKSTLLRILSGLLSPSTGHALVAGLNVVDHGLEFRRRVGFVVADERSFHWPLSGRHNLEYFAALHGHAATTARARTSELLARVGLSDAADRPYRTYSRGMRQRLAMARGLLGAPDVLLLDEPTLGLDPIGARDLRRFLRDDVIRGAGRTALVGTNDPGEARALGDRVFLLERGRLIREVTPDRLDAELGL
jgi:ABC-2 type transport system ATP-binding protein